MNTMKKIIALALTIFISFGVIGCRKDDLTADDPVVKKANETLKIHCYTHKSLNPLDNANDINMQMLRLMFESLIQCDKTQKPQPQLAEEYSVSQDGLVWTVKLKENVKWHDGTDFTAKDVLHTYNYVMENAENSPYAINVSNIEYVNSTSDYTVNFKLEFPQANFVNLLEIPIVKSGEFTPVGTGPYVYKETQNKIIYLTANDKWHGGKVNVKNIHVKILPDKETATYAYVSKEIDAVSVTSGDDMGNYTSNSDNVIVSYPSNRFTFVGINTNSEPLSNRMFRKAIAHAINKDSINSDVLLSHGSVANSCINSDWWMYHTGVTTYSYSKDKSVNILNDVKKNMKIAPVNLMVNMENSDKVKTAEMIQKNLADCGITVYIEYVDWATFSERVSSGNYQMYIGSIKYSAEINPQYVIKNPGVELQKLFVEFQSQTDENGLKKKYFEIQEKIAMELQIIPLYFDVSTVLYNKRIEGQLNPCRINVFNGVQTLELDS